MKILFVHNNFPGQFLHLARALAENGHEVVFLSQHRRADIATGNIKLVPVPVPQADGQVMKSESHKASWQIFHAAEVFAQVMTKLAKQGFYPDAVCAHPGWGGSLYAPDIFPDAAYIAYAEWFYTKGENYHFFSRGPHTPASFAANRQRNLCQLDALSECDAAISPTFWQMSQYPAEYAPKINVVHDGVDMDYFSPSPAQEKREDSTVQGLDLAALPEIVTYATRGMEPYRGFPQFFKSIPGILAERPNCHIVIMANDEVRYSASRTDGKTWGEVMRAEVPFAADRVHFLNFGPYEEYRKVLRASSVHVYLTAPFVLSWSMLEAMSCGCLVVASATSPVREVIRHRQNGFLVPFRDSAEIAKTVCEVLERTNDLGEIRANARKTIAERYDLKKMLPAQIEIIDKSVRNKKIYQQLTATQANR